MMMPLSLWRKDVSEISLTTQKFKLRKRGLKGVPLWLSGLRTQCCHCSHLGHCCDVGLILGPGTSTCHRHGRKGKGKKKKKEREYSVVFIQDDLGKLLNESGDGTIKSVTFNQRLKTENISPE